MGLKRSRAKWLGAIGALLVSSGAIAQEPFIGQITAVGETFCPRNFMEASGQLLPISSNTALFSLIGCQYGGDCRTTFALPDLRGRAMISHGQGPGLPYYQQGATGGRTTHTMNVTEMPNHRHSMMASTDAPVTNSPSGAAMPTYTDPTSEIYSDQAPGSAPLNSLVIGPAGGSQPFSITQPTIALRMCVAVFGIYPSRS
ncbi:tail fiber protein [Maricaulis sp.]|uniref:phage tail protein n=1 Tax=Maricaulis sp. TaxID=1486257 RepID=UPI0025BB205A|nr:tail fiber protein [Maricaulis sp.]